MFLTQGSPRLYLLRGTSRPVLWCEGSNVIQGLGADSLRTSERFYLARETIPDKDDPTRNCFRFFVPRSQILLLTAGDRGGKCRF